MVLSTIIKQKLRVSHLFAGRFSDLLGRAHHHRPCGGRQAQLIVPCPFRTREYSGLPQDLRAVKNASETAEEVEEHGMKRKEQGYFD